MRFFFISDDPEPPVRNVGRRKSVFAEAYNPEEDEDDKPAVSVSFAFSFSPYPFSGSSKMAHIIEF